MTRLRFFSDASERQLEAAYPDVEFEDHCVELDDAGAIEFAHQLGAYEEDDDSRSTSGVDALQDTGAFSTRSNASRMPGYMPPDVKTVFYKDQQRQRAANFPPRRKTRGQP